MTLLQNITFFKCFTKGITKNRKTSFSHGYAAQSSVTKRQKCINDMNAFTRQKIEQVRINIKFKIYLQEQKCSGIY